MNRYEAALTGNDHLIDESDAPGSIANPEEFKDVLAELDDCGRNVTLAESTGRWMRLGEHAGRLRAVCLSAGLGQELTARLVTAYIAEALPVATE